MITKEMLDRMPEVVPIRDALYAWLGEHGADSLDLSIESQEFIGPKQLIQWFADSPSDDVLAFRIAAIRVLIDSWRTAHVTTPEPK
jgi:hypothetical protein